MDEMFPPEIEAIRDSVNRFMDNEVKPVIEGRYPLADAAKVLGRVLGRGATGKLILTP